MPMLGAAAAPCFTLSSFAGGARRSEPNPYTSGKVEQTLLEGEQFYLFLSCLFGTVVKFCSSILGYQLHHCPYRLIVVSAFVQMLFALLLWMETEKSRCG